MDRELVLPSNRSPKLSQDSQRLLHGSAKSYWKERQNQIWTFFCPLCRVQRKLPYHPRPGTRRHFVQIGLTAAVLTLATWNWFEWKGIISFVPIWTVFEVIYRLKLRAALKCSQCGFDPYLYVTDLSKARHEVEEHWKKKFAEKGIPYPKAESTLTETSAQS